MEIQMFLWINIFPSPLSTSAIPLKYQMTFSAAIFFLIFGYRRPSPGLSGGWKSIYTVGVHVEREMGWTAPSNDTANCIVLGDQGSVWGLFGGWWWGRVPPVRGFC